MDTVALNTAHRQASLGAMTNQTLDLLVVGGGIVGTGCALDAATRGLAVGLVEARDIAAGTSSRSSKLIHGGLRYLEMLQFRLVGEALKERGLLLHDLAPHLVTPVPFLYPLKHRGWERLYAGAGVALYDVLARAAGKTRRLPPHRHLSRTGALRLAPALRRDSLVGALQYYDAQVDDARFALFVARTAATYGAAIASQCPATSLMYDEGRVIGARVRDNQTGEEFEIRAKHVIVATGVWTGDMLTSGDAGETVSVRASKGIHLVVPGHKIRSSSGLILRTEHSVLFVIPWGENWIIGTTDTDWAGDKAHPAAHATEIAYLLSTVNSVLAQPLSSDDVIGVYAGLRPLVAGDAEHTAKLSREHVVAQPEPGLTVVAGGKFTTYRVMARDAVDAAVREGLSGTAMPPCVTSATPLVGAEGFRDLTDDPGLLSRRWGLSEDRIRSLLHRYGSLLDEVLVPTRDQPRLMTPVTGAPGYLLVEVRYAASHEGALHLEDVLTRRTRISIETADRGLSAAKEVGDMIAPVLGWDADRTHREIEQYRSRVGAELAGNRASDDATANHLRIQAPEACVGGAPRR